MLQGINGTETVIALEIDVLSLFMRGGTKPYKFPMPWVSPDVSYALQSFSNNDSDRPQNRLSHLERNGLDPVVQAHDFLEVILVVLLCRFRHSLDVILRD